MPKIPYDRIPLIPAIIAETVCHGPYTGSELSTQVRSASDVTWVEAARQKMSPADVREFSDLCEKACRYAYEHGAKWMVKCAAAKGTRGRDQLYSLVAHWLAAYLTDPDLFRRNLQDA